MTVSPPRGIGNPTQAPEHGLSPAGKITYLSTSDVLKIGQISDQIIAERDKLNALQSSNLQLQQHTSQLQHHNAHLQQHSAQLQQRITHNEASISTSFANMKIAHRDQHSAEAKLAQANADLKKVTDAKKEVADVKASLVAGKKETEMEISKSDARMAVLISKDKAQTATINALVTKAQEQTRAIEDHEKAYIAKMEKIAQMKRDLEAKRAAKAAQQKTSSPKGKESTPILPTHITQPGLNVPNTAANPAAKK